MTEQRRPCIQYLSSCPITAQRRHAALPSPQVGSLSENRNHNHAPEPYRWSNGMRCTMSGERQGPNPNRKVIPSEVHTAVGSATEHARGNDVVCG